MSNTLWQCLYNASLFLNKLLGNTECFTQVSTRHTAWRLPGSRYGAEATSEPPSGVTGIEKEQH